MFLFFDNVSCYCQERFVCIKKHWSTNCSWREYIAPDSSSNKILRVSFTMKMKNIQCGLIDEWTRLLKMPKEFSYHASPQELISDCCFFLYWQTTKLWWFSTFDDTLVSRWTFSGPSSYPDDFHWKSFASKEVNLNTPNKGLLRANSHYSRMSGSQKRRLITRLP